MPEPSTSELLAAINGLGARMDTKFEGVEAQLKDMRSDLGDHETRIRTVEKATNIVDRLVSIDEKVERLREDQAAINKEHGARITQHDAAFSSINKQVGENTTGLSSVKEVIAADAPPKAHPVAWAAVVMSALSVVVVIVGLAINAN